MLDQTSLHLSSIVQRRPPLSGRSITIPTTIGYTWARLNALPPVTDPSDHNLEPQITTLVKQDVHEQRINYFNVTAAKPSMEIIPMTRGREEPGTPAVGRCTFYGESAGGVEENEQKRRPRRVTEQQRGSSVMRRKRSLVLRNSYLTLRAMVKIPETQISGWDLQSGCAKEWPHCAF